MVVMGSCPNWVSWQTRLVTFSRRNRASALVWSRVVVMHIALVMLTVLLYGNEAYGDTGVESLFDLNLADLLDVQVVTAAAGYEQNLESAPASVTIVHAEEWRAAGAKTLYQALQRVPGFHVTLAQTGASTANPILRGLSGDFGQQILLLVDGIPFRSVREGGAPWGAFLPLNSFKRIEVIRGSGSAVYGADAVGGIINLVSHAPGQSPAELSLEAGNHNYYALEGAYGGRLSDHSFNLAWSTQISDVESDRIVEQDRQSLVDAELGTSASHAPGVFASQYQVHTLRAAWQWQGVSAAYTDIYSPEAGTGSGVAQSLDPDGEAVHRTQLAQLDFDLSNRVPGDMRLRATWQKTYSEVDATLSPPGAVLPVNAEGNFVDSDSPPEEIVGLVTFTDGVKGNPQNTNHVYALQINHVVDINPRHKLRWAIGTEHYDNHTREYKNFGPGVWEGESVVDGQMTDVTGGEGVYLKDAERRLYYLSLQDQWTISDQWIATLGIRYDHYSDFDSTTNPRLGLLWHPNKQVTFKVFAGSAFRAPSFVDLYAKNNPAGIGNPDLNAETVNLVDLGFSANFVVFESLQLETSLYHYAADNLIEFIEPEGGGVAQAQNSGRLNVRGIEQQINWRSGDALNIDFNFTVIDPYDTVHVDTSAIARRMANLSLYYRMGITRLFLGGHWVSHRERNEGDPRPDVDHYLWMTGRVEADWNDWQLGLTIDNLLNDDAREPSVIAIPFDNPLPGRQFRLQLSRRF